MLYALYRIHSECCRPIEYVFEYLVTHPLNACSEFLAYLVFSECVEQVLEWIIDLVESILFDILYIGIVVLVIIFIFAFFS